MDLSEKEGQIAHLDHNPSNSNEANLAFLCLAHHSIYDSKTSQHKNYTLLEVKRAKEKLCELIATRLELLLKKHQAEVPKTRDADRNNLDNLLAVLPSEGGIERLRDHNFAASFERDWFEDIERFYQTRRDRPEFEFLDDDLEKLRSELIKSIRVFLGKLSEHTFYMKGSNTRMGVPPEWEDEQPQRFEKAVSEIHKAADRVCQNYDDLVRQARRLLLN